MTIFHDSKTVRERHGKEIVFTVTDRLLMIHSETLNCQFPRDSVIPMMDDAQTHGILRFADRTSLNIGLTLFIAYGDIAPLAMFLQTYTDSKVVA